MRIYGVTMMPTTMMPEDITPERREVMINRLAEMVVRSGMGTVALLFLQGMKPYTFVGGEMLQGFATPWLGFAGLEAQQGNIEEHINLLEDRKNVDRLCDKIEELMSKEKDREAERKRGMDWKARLKDAFSRG